MTPFAFGITITVLARSAGRDENDDPIAPAGDPHTIEGCAVIPRPAEELDNLGRHGDVTTLTVYAPADADISATDRVTVPGHDGTFEVEGDPQDWSSPISGRAPGIEIHLRRARG